MLKVIGGSSGYHLMSDGSLRSITQLNNGGAGTSLIKEGSGSGSVIELNSISNGTGLGLALNAGNITLTNISTLSNAGILTGLSLVSNGTAPNYSLKSIDSGTGILVSNTNADVILITNTSPASGISLASVSGGFSLISSTSTNPAFKTKSITQGTNITISDISNNLTITNSSPASSILLSSITGTGGYSLISSTSINPSFITKTIAQGTGITIADTANNLTISTASRTECFSPFGDPLAQTGVSNFAGSAYSVQTIYMPKTFNLTNVNMYRNGATSTTFLMAIYDTTNTRIYNGSLTANTSTTISFIVSPAVALTANTYYYVAIFGTATGMYSGTSAGSAIVNSSLHASIQYVRVSFTGTTMPTTLPITGGSTASIIYPPFTLIGTA
jgi:hypothetical protein